LIYRHVVAFDSSAAGFGDERKAARSRVCKLDLRPGLVLAAARRRRRDKVFKKVPLFSSDIQVIFMHG
jgi:hypothetical protein